MSGVGVIGKTMGRIFGFVVLHSWFVLLYRPEDERFFVIM